MEHRPPVSTLIRAGEYIAAVAHDRRHGHPSSPDRNATRGVSANPASACWRCWDWCRRSTPPSLSSTAPSPEAWRATILPGLSLREGIPPHLRTMVVVPTLLTTRAAIEEHIERLEIHYLASPDGELHFALLSDWTDAPAEHTAEDAALLDIAIEGIARLNRLHGAAPAGDRFVLLHRRRVWSERAEAMDGLGAQARQTARIEPAAARRAGHDFRRRRRPPPGVPPDVRYVITLDADTRLPRDAVRRLVGKMAHPLNRPRFDAATRSESSKAMRCCSRGSRRLCRWAAKAPLFQRVFSSAGGIDPYAAAASDVYQDLFGLGSYAGKGIYDVDAFEAALADRVPEGTLLSHDLFEGTFARAGLVSDIEVVEEFPSRYDVAAARQHRWSRGDWQLLPWILGRGDAAGDDRGSGTLPLIGLWKMLDNLRRTLSAPAGVAALLAGWLLPSTLRSAVERLHLRDDRIAGAAAGVRRRSCPSRAGHHASQPSARAAQGCLARRDTDRFHRHISGAPGNLDDGCDRPDAVSLVREPAQSAAVGDRGAGEDSVSASRFRAPIAAWPAPS